MESSSPKSPRQKLKRINILLAFAHAAEAIAMALATRLTKVENQTVPWITNFGIGRPMVIEQKVFRDMPVAYFSVVFLALASLNHFVCLLNPRNIYYDDVLKRSRNRIRWSEYFFSASIMHVHIAMLSGITDVHSLFGIFGLSATSMLFGLISEELSIDSDKAYLKRYVLYAGCVPYLAMWFNIFCYFFYSVTHSSPPAWIWTIIILIFTLDCLFAVNAFWGAGVFRCRPPSYIRVEVCYMMLSVVSKSLLAWIVYGGTGSL
jgi:hypothetical protein